MTVEFDMEFLRVWDIFYLLADLIKVSNRVFN